MLEPYSRLGRLYTYSKDAAFSAQENFTTEALAMAIADDPRPMIEALRRVAGAPTGFIPNAAVIRPSTQVALPGGGRLDLVLEVLDERHRLTGEVWVEVKIGATETGSQLDAYEERRRQVNHPVWLLTLAPEPLRNEVANLTWSELYQAARHVPSEHASWRELRTFLEEQMVANDALGPIRDREAASLEPAYEVMQKVSELVIAVHRKLPSLFPEPVAAKLRWRAEGELLNYVGANFRASGELVGWSRAFVYGLTAQDGTAYWTVAVRAGQAARATVEQARKIVDQAGFGADWDRPPSGPSILVARIRATAVGTHESAVSWFEARLREVAASRVVETLIATAAAKAIEPAPVDEDA